MLVSHPWSPTSTVDNAVSSTSNTVVIIAPFNISRLLFYKRQPYLFVFSLRKRTLGLPCFLCSVAPSVPNAHRSNFLSCHLTHDPRSREASPISVLLLPIRSLVSFRSLLAIAFLSFAHHCLYTQFLPHAAPHASPSTCITP